jgi:predicted XRE-type DNA-binding protein
MCDKKQLTKELMDKYKYIPEVTEYLDGKVSEFKKGNFDLLDLYSIILWKVNRFPTKDGHILEEDTLSIIKELANVTELNDDVEAKIKELLKRNQIKLSMVSTILSFVNPEVFQIIDKRTNRIVMGDSAEYDVDYTKEPVKYYFAYLKKLKTLNIEFTVAGRAFYQLDKDVGHGVDDKPDTDKIKEIQKKYKK